MLGRVWQFDRSHAFVRLQQGIEAPRSGSIELNGKIVAEQIGAQIFIDSLAMVTPGNPKLAFDLAGKAASVSHDGEAVLAAQFLAVMEAQAFVQPDTTRCLSLGRPRARRDSFRSLCAKALIWTHLPWPRHTH